ncbi:hypothetical protein KKC87_04280 [Patescibacteria group bacterium]|nr:hypothetical protein [Patescibacteria group bacterium]
MGIFLPDPYTDWQMEFYYTTGAVTNINRYQTLKTGATHNWGIIYRDIAGRITPVIGADDITKYIPFATEWLATTTAAPSTTAGATTTGGTTTAVATTTAAPSLTNAGKRPLITFNINHLPPPQAVTYEIVYAGNKSVSWYLHLLGYNFTYGKITHDEVGSSTLSDVYRLRIDKAQTRTRGNLHNWSVEEYVWQKGDRIRIFGKVDEAGILTEISEAIYDVEITGVFTDTDTNTKIGETTDPSTNEWIYFPKNTNIAFTPTTGLSPNEFVDNLWVEIYRPFTVETNLFFTTGMTFEIATDGFGNRYHKGDIDQIVDINGISTTPASITNTSHDGWKYQRNFRNVYDNLSFALWAESEYASDFYISNKLTSQGNPVADVDSQQQNVLTKRLRHGGMINVGSQINLIADFDYDDYLDLKDEDGPIEGLRLVGFVLKVLQYTKVVSIYIGRKESFSASGDAQYLFTDNIFGSVRPAMEDWGTRHPSSVTVHNRHLYFWDESEGIVVRDAANGMEVISDNKMKRYFHDKAVALRAYATQHNVWVEFAFSQATNELVCLFGTGSGTQEIITFSEDDQRWKNQFDIAFERDIMYSIGKRLFQTVSAKVYEWWVGSGYNRLTGVQVTPKLVIYAILDPAKVKTFESIIVYQNGGRPQFNNIQIPEKATAGAEAMQTNIYDVNITEKEGVFYCQILRDINTPGVGTQAYKEMNGRKMRGLFARIEMKPQNALSLTGKVTISNIIVLSTPSERSK